MKRVFITTLGCKVNQYESAAFKAGFEEAGRLIVTKKEKADLLLVHTCAVTANGAAQSRQVIRQVLRANQNATILITGCYAELGAQELEQEKELAGRNYFLIGNSKKDKLVPLVLQKDIFTKSSMLGTVQDAKEICRLTVGRFGERSRAYLRVQDGC